MELDIRTVVIRGIAMYTCSVCGAKGMGRTVTLALNSVAEEELKRAIANIGVDNMPVHWCANGKDDIRCPDHIDNAAIESSRNLWLGRFKHRLRQCKLPQSDIDHIVDADGAEVHLDVSPEDAADYEVVTVLRKTQRKPLAWEELAKLYNKHNAGRRAYALPMAAVFDWAKGRKDLTVFDSQEGTLYAID